ncbi:hypothetical protein K438DRAFT_1836846 [Mycena galopus ATCC 62051]|nr:hypothetical protein K438DRAFT_1836846 [Mycena galopus ATCC 62051]
MPLKVHDIWFPAMMLFFFAPALLQRYPGPFADAICRVVDWVTMGVTSIAFAFAVWLTRSIVCDIYLRSCSESPTALAELEEGTASQPAAPATELDGTVPPGLSAKGTSASLVGKLLLFLFMMVSACILLWLHDVVSLKQSPLANLSHAALYLLRGCGVVVLIWSIGFCALWVRTRCAPRAPATPETPGITMSGDEGHGKELEPTEKA